MRNASLELSRVQTTKHALAVVRKMERIAGLKDLLEMWEKEEKTDENIAYVKELRRQLRNAQVQLQAMKV